MLLQLGLRPIAYSQNSIYHPRLRILLFNSLSRYFLLVYYSPLPTLFSIFLTQQQTLFILLMITKPQARLCSPMANESFAKTKTMTGADRRHCALRHQIDFSLYIGSQLLLCFQRVIYTEPKKKYPNRKCLLDLGQYFHSNFQPKYTFNACVYMFILITGYYAH